ncbi:ribonuclease P protein component [candidate division WOR-3 bacterium]|nr:ribonuclease P protein component [candidate division WOR-3 bacterium]
MSPFVYGKLSKKKDIENLLSKGQRDYFSFISIVHKPSSQTMFSIGLRKGIRSAVARNKLRRRLKALLVKNVSRMTSCFEFIVIAKKEAAYLDFEELEKQLTEAMKKAGLV